MQRSVGRTLNVGSISAGLPAVSALGSALSGQSIPTPESVLGFRPGADFELATYEQSVEYFQRLDAASDRIMMMETGRTSEGRTWYISAISTAENLANLERHRDAAARLAHPANLTDAEARDLASTAREGLNNPILGGTRSVAVRRSGYEGLSER